MLSTHSSSSAWLASVIVPTHIDFQSITPDLKVSPFVGVLFRKCNDLIALSQVGDRQPLQPLLQGAHTVGHIRPTDTREPDQAPVPTAELIVLVRRRLPLITASLALPNAYLVHLERRVAAPHVHNIILILGNLVPSELELASLLLLYRKLTFETLDHLLAFRSITPCQVVNMGNHDHDHIISLVWHLPLHGIHRGDK